MKYSFPTFETHSDLHFHIQIYIFQKLISFKVIFTAVASFIIASQKRRKLKRFVRKKPIGSLSVLLYQYSRLD